MPISTGTRLKAQILKAVIDQITGGGCLLVDREDSIKIVLSEDQKTWFKNFLDAQLEMKKKPDIEIDAIGIILPVIMKRIGPILAAGGGIAAAWLIGKGFLHER